jgi:hypothetical protein
MEFSVAKVLAFEGNKQNPSDNMIRKVPGRPRCAEVRRREHLTADKVKSLMMAAARELLFLQTEQSSSYREIRLM